VYVNISNDSRERYLVRNDPEKRSRTMDKEDEASSNVPPENANEGCVGPESSLAGKASACEGCPNQKVCASGGGGRSPDKDNEQVEIRNALQGIQHVVLILSGKGGVGKSTVACQVAQTLALRGYSVGVLDIDICGPSAPRMLGVSGSEVRMSGSGWTPVYVNENLEVMSIAFLLSDSDAAVIWRGPRKNGMIKQFLTETDWGNGEGLDYLIVDTPPGTSDEHISTVQYLRAIDGVSGAIVVSTPEEVSMADVRKELNFCKKTAVPVIGVVENMTTFKSKIVDLTFTQNDNHVDCTEEVLQILKEKCPEVLSMSVKVDVFAPSNGGPQKMAANFNVPFLGSLPLDPNLLKSCENGQCFVEHYSDSSATKPLNHIVDRLIEALPVVLEEELVE